MKLTQKLALTYIRSRLRILSLFSKKKAAAFAFDLFCTPQIRNLNTLPAMFKKAELLKFSFQQYSITGYRWNKNAAAKALIIHGFESSVINFDHFVQPLIDKGYEVLAFDAPAHGRSSGRQINAIIFRDFIIHLQHHYGPFDAWIAHSFGGLALCLALAEMDHRERDRVVLIAPATNSITALEHFFHFTGIKDRQVKQDVEKIIHDFSGHPLSWFNIQRTLPEIRAQVLWVQDKDDMITPYKDAEIIKEANYPQVHFVITQGLGHRRVYRDAGVSKAVVGFLENKNPETAG